MKKHSLLLALFALSLPLALQAREGWSPARADKTIVKLKDNFGTCTGTRISNEGHILTARHCFSACLIAKKYVTSERIYPEDGWQSPKLYTFDKSSEAICEVEIDGVPSKVKVLATSPSFMTEIDKGSMSLYDYPRYLDYENKSFFQSGDFLIAQQLEVKNTRCRPNSLNLGRVTSVHYKGYPAASKGRPGRNSDGKNLMLAEGHLVDSITTNQCVPQDGSVNMNRLKDTYDRPELQLSTVDILPGASGSSLLNQDGEIIGLLNSTYAYKVDIYQHYCSGSAVAIKLSHVLELARNHMKDSEISDAFNCQN